MRLTVFKMQFQCTTIFEFVPEGPVPRGFRSSTVIVLCGMQAVIDLSCVIEVQNRTDRLMPYLVKINCFPFVIKVNVTS